MDTPMKAPKFVVPAMAIALVALAFCAGAMFVQPVDPGIPNIEYEDKIEALEAEIRQMHDVVKEAQDHAAKSDEDFRAAHENLFQAQQSIKRHQEGRLELDNRLRSAESEVRKLRAFTEVVVNPKSLEITRLEATKIYEALRATRLPPPTSADIKKALTHVDPVTGKRSPQRPAGMVETPEQTSERQAKILKILRGL